MGYPTGLSAAAGVSAKADRKDLGKTDCTSGKAKEGKSRTITVVKEPAEMNSAGSFFWKWRYSAMRKRACRVAACFTKEEGREPAGEAGDIREHPYVHH